MEDVLSSIDYGRTKRPPSRIPIRKSPKQKDFKWVTDTAEGREVELKEQLLTRNGIVGRCIVKTPKYLAIKVIHFRS